MDEIEKRIVDILKDGHAATWVIADRLKARGQTKRIRLILNAMEWSGIVRRNERYTNKNNIVWELS